MPRSRRNTWRTGSSTKGSGPAWNSSWSSDAGKTIALATHELGTRDVLADRCIVFSEEHRVVGQGPPREIPANRDLRRGVNLIHEHSHVHRGVTHAHEHATGPHQEPDTADPAPPATDNRDRAAS